MTDEHHAVAALVCDLHWQIDQMKLRRIKNRAGNPYNPSYYKRGLGNATARGDIDIVEYVTGFLYRSPSDGYKKLEEADSLDLACEALVADERKPYAWLFSDADRDAARKRLGPHQEAIDQRRAERRKRVDAVRMEMRRTGLPPRSELDESLRTRNRNR
jgi:hypothetical protein